MKPIRRPKRIERVTIEVWAPIEIFARHTGIDPSDYWEMVEGKRPWPNGFHDQLFAEMLPAALTSEHELSTLSPMATAEVSSNALRSRGRMSEDVRNHRSTKRLAKLGITFADVSEALGERLGRKVPRSTVQGWHKGKDDPNARSIPADAADAMKDLYGVPLEAWSRIIPKP